eukprot:m.250935 g.250935  ORF g.250935 m.250935 type:complete len:139 (-) comp16939_c0_seq1:117-533(-)
MNADTGIYHSALPKMIKLAKANARLHLRQQITDEDAVVAIWLFEEMMISLQGYSVLGFGSKLSMHSCPLGMFRTGSDDTTTRAAPSLIHDLAVCLARLHERIRRFCQNVEQEVTDNGMSASGLDLGGADGSGDDENFW